jgi:hypothetical protein
MKAPKTPAPTAITSGKGEAARAGPESAPASAEAVPPAKADRRVNSGISISRCLPRASGSAACGRKSIGAAVADAPQCADFRGFPVTSTCAVFARRSIIPA